MKIGYARVSTDDQSLALQKEALQAAGCDRIFEDQGVSGADFARPGLKKVLDRLGPGDTLVVWKLDRLGRSLLELVKIINALAARKIEFFSLTENIDTRSPGGRLMFHIMAALAEFERSLIGERTKAGIKAARAKGRRIGRPPALNPEQQVEAVAAVRLFGETIASVAKRFGVHPRTIRRLLRAQSHSLDPGKEYRISADPSLISLSVTRENPKNIVRETVKSNDHTSHKY